ncbi:MAG: IS4 family transposase [Planctomycetota bacterium]|jgi:hypothetical protein
MSALSNSEVKLKPLQLLPVFCELLPVALILDWLKECPKRFYFRLFTPLVVLWGLIYQRLNSDHTTDAAVSYLKSGAVDQLDNRHHKPLSERIRSESTAAYCKGRQRLPLLLLQKALRHTHKVIQQWLGDTGRWLGHSVALLDGTTLLLRPYDDLVQHYGQHHNHTGKTYWVLMRVVAAFCLRTGTLLGVSEGSLRNSEQSLGAEVLSQAEKGSVYVGDRAFGIFSIAQAARNAGVFVLLRLTHPRAKYLAGRKIVPGTDCQVQWKHTRKDQVHQEMSKDPIEGRLIYVHLKRDGFRPVSLYLFTTLLDCTRYSKASLVELYGCRYHVEFDLRYVKTTLEMDLLSGKSVDVVKKELNAGLLAYNLIRGFMVQAAKEAKLSVFSLSFTRCWRRVFDALFAWGLKAPEQRVPALLERLARCRLPKRERFRLEPRAIRKRAEKYPKLKGCRDQARRRLREQLSA